MLPDGGDLVVAGRTAFPGDACEASSACDGRTQGPDRLAAVTALTAFCSLQAFPKRSLERGARLSGITLHVKRDVFRDRDRNKAIARHSLPCAVHGTGAARTAPASFIRSATSVPRLLVTPQSPRKPRLAPLSPDIHRSGVARPDRPSRSDPPGSGQGNDRQ
jgi:hypothetical protein